MNQNFGACRAVQRDNVFIVTAEREQDIAAVDREGTDCIVAEIDSVFARLVAWDWDCAAVVLEDITLFIRRETKRAANRTADQCHRLLGGIFRADQRNIRAAVKFIGQVDCAPCAREQRQAVFSNNTVFGQVAAALKQYARGDWVIGFERERIIFINREGELAIAAGFGFRYGVGIY